MEKSKIRFSGQKTVKCYTIQPEINLQINSDKYRPLLQSCHQCQQYITQVLNQSSKHQINMVGIEEEAIKISTMNKPWYEDLSPVLLLKHLQNKQSLDKFLWEYNREVERQIPKDKSGMIKFRYLNLEIVIPNVERN